MAAVVRYTIYSHADADGGIAALLLSWDLKQRFGSSIDVRIVPVDYGPPSPRGWFNRSLKLPCAVLDFALHPQLLMERSYAAMRRDPALRSIPCFWLDHHATGGQFAFLGPGDLRNFAPRELVAVWDTKATSTPGLMRSHRASIGLADETITRFETLIDYAEIIDGALYQSAAMAGDFSLPTVQLAALFASQHPSVSRRGLYRKLIADLQHERTIVSLSGLARDPVYQAIIDYEAHVAGDRREAYQRRATVSPSGRVAIFDFREDPAAWRGIGRFVPYELMPQAYWAVHISPKDSSGTCAITCGENPWCRPRISAALGDLFARRFGGGGHSYVAGGRIADQDAEAVRQLVAELDGLVDVSA